MFYKLEHLFKKLEQEKEKMKKNKIISVNKYNKLGKSISWFQDIMNHYHTKFLIREKFNLIYLAS